MKNKIKSFARISAVENHQLLSFSPIFAQIKIGNNESPREIFFPGCSLMSLGEEGVVALYEILRLKYPDMALSGYCCGKPSKHIDHRKFKKRIAKVRREHPYRIFTACPNCYKTLGEEKFEVVSIWKDIEELLPEKYYNSFSGEAMMLHDPCASRNNLVDHQAIRRILEKLGIEIIEFENNREKTLCCGKANMAMTLNPELGNKMLLKRVSQCKEEKVVSYCASCVESFDRGNKTGLHIAQLLVGKGEYSWGNRIKVASNILR